MEKTTYDFIVVGSSLTAGVIAHTLSKKFLRNVCWLGASEVLGDTDDHQEYMFLPQNDEILGELDQLSKLLGRPLYDTNARELPPQTYENGQLIPFVGFGEHNFATATELSSYTVDKYFQLSDSPDQWLKDLRLSFLGDSDFQAQVTQIKFREGHFDHVVINGAQQVRGQHLIYALPPKSLESLVSLSDFNSGPLHKILKAKTYSDLKLWLQHNQAIATREGFHILVAAKNEYEPCVGQFYSHDNNHYSLWSCLTPVDLAEDPEYLAGVLKHMKKLIKRAYPTALENILSEKITVKNDDFGFIPLKFSPFGCWPKTSGLWLAHQQLVPQSGVTGSLAAGFELLTALSENLSMQPRTDESYTLASL